MTDNLCAYLFVRGLKEVNYRLNGDYKKFLDGQKIDTDLCNLYPSEFFNTKIIVDIGPGCSPYSYILTNNIKRTFGKDVKLILIEPDTKLARYHLSFKNQNLDEILRIWGDLPKIINDAYKAASELDIEVINDKIENVNLPKNCFVIASYVMIYISLDYVPLVLDKIAKACRSAIIVKLHSHYKMKGIIRKSCILYEIDWEDSFRRPKSCLNLSDFLKYLSEEHKISYSLYRCGDSYGYWSNLNLIMWKQDLFDDYKSINNKRINKLFTKVINALRTN